jgi:hypothetical protein
VQSILSDSRPLLLAVAPEASMPVKGTAISAIVAGLADALQPQAMYTDEEMLPWQAFYSMGYMVHTYHNCLCTGMASAMVISRSTRLRGCSFTFCSMIHHLRQQAALEAICGATSAAQLLVHAALLPAWQAAAVTLQLCAKVI